MKVGAIIPCRLSSNRLPGKVLMTIAGKAVLQHIVDRLLLVNRIDEIIIATSLEKSDDPIETFAIENSIKYFRGDLDNVAERFLHAAKAFSLDYAIRINGDNAFVDCITLDKMLLNIDSTNKKFITNVPERTFPFGMSIEIVHVSFYQNIFKDLSVQENHREHVTLYFYDNEAKHLSEFEYHKNTNSPKAKGIKLALDTKEDLKMVTYIIEHLENHSNYILDEVVEEYYKYVEK